MYQKLEEYSNTEETKAMIKLESDKITNEVSKKYATQEEMSSKITQTADEIKSIVSVSIGTVNLVSNSDFSHKNTAGQYDLKAWSIDNNEASEPIFMKNDKTWLLLFKQTSGQMFATQMLKPINQNEYYTLSFKAINRKGAVQSLGFTLSVKSNDNVSIKNYDYWPDVGTNSNQVQQFSYTFQTPNNDAVNSLEFGIQTYNSNESYTDLLITDIQLEIGKVATEWRASQPDYYDKIEQYSKVVQTVDKISGEVNKKVGKDEFNSKIEQTAKEINSEVSKKVGNNEIISKINQSAEAVGIDADKINLTANDIFNLIAGNAINLTSKNITITSDAFKVDKNGKVTCSDIDITGGTINLTDDGQIASFEISDGGGEYRKYVDVYSWGISMANTSNGDLLDLTPEEIFLTGGNSNTTTKIRTEGITTPKLTQTSLKSKKKNIKQLNVDALELIKDADICLYNLKGEKAKSKKHIGLVIGDGYNCPNEVISEDGQGVEQYSMTSLAWKAIQEQQEIIESLTKRIEKLEAK